MKKITVIAIVVICVLFAGCNNGNTAQIFDVTIGSLANGSIMANPISGIEGTEITLTVNPDAMYRLEAGTLKYNSTFINETTFKFNLPAANVTVTAEFESKFIGSWNSENLNYTFHGNTFIERTNEKYTQKGTWKKESPNKLILTYTHNRPPGSVGVETIEELIENSYPHYYMEGEVEFISEFFKWFNIVEGWTIEFILAQ